MLGQQLPLEAPSEEWGWGLEAWGLSLCLDNLNTLPALVKKILVVCDSNRDGELLNVCGTKFLIPHNCLSQHDEAHDSATARRHAVNYLEAKMSPWESKDKAQDNSVEAAKSYGTHVPTNEVNHLGMLCTLSQV